MRYQSVFDIIGPVMIGPSSSHTAGAVQIGNAVHGALGGMPDALIAHYYESFAETHVGHGTDSALVGGALGFATDDLRIPDALSIAKAKGMDARFVEEPGPSPLGHPNSVVVEARRGGQAACVAGISIGGGIVKICDIQTAPAQAFPNGAKAFSC
jgi:L-serine dehydratase